MASAKAVAALGGTAGAMAGPPQVSLDEQIDDALAEEIARMPQGHLPKPLRKFADRARVLEALVKLGYPLDQVEARMKVYEGAEGMDYDDSDFNTFEVPPGR